MQFIADFSCTFHRSRIIDIVRRFFPEKNLEMQKKDKKSSIEADIAVPTNSNFLL